MGDDVSEDTDDTDEIDGLDISTPISLPLTKQQLQLLKDPDNFSLEEEFYILYDALTGMAIEFVKALKMVELGSVASILGPILGPLLGIEDDIETMRDHGLRAMCLAHWVGNNIQGVPQVPKIQLIQPEESLDAEKLTWGRAVRDVITEDQVLTQIWAFRLDELITTIQTYPTSCAEAMASFLGTPPDMRENHVDVAKVQAELASHRIAVIEAMKKKWMSLWNQERTTDHNGTGFGDDFSSELERYAKEHENEFRFLNKRNKDASDRIRKRLESDPEHKKRKTEWENRPKRSLGETIQDIMAATSSNECNNPNCKIHGEAVRRRLAAQDNQQQNQEITEPTRTARNTMAFNKTDLADKKNAKPNKFMNVTLQFVNDPNSKAIRLPEGMDFEEAKYWINKMEEESNRTFRFEFQFAGWAIMDAMWASYQAAVKLHGFAHIGDDQREGFFGTWSVPPKLVTIPTGPKTTQQIPWGPIEVSGLSAPMQPSIAIVEGHYCLKLHADIKNSERDVADKMMKFAMEILAEKSIYRGKAIEMDFSAMDPNIFASWDPNKAPKFLDLGNPEIDELVLPSSVHRLVDVTIWTPIRKMDMVMKHKIPLRRTVTLAGAHGVGKTLTALATAKIATENGWTFLYLRNLKQLVDALYFAEKYQPAIVFAEDMDELFSGERNEEMNKIFNVVDGIDRKGARVMLVSSTNYVEQIHRGMLRPGRTDTIIMFTPPDEEAVLKLMQIYGRNIIDIDADLTAVAKRLAGQLPSVIREAVELSKLMAIADKKDDEGELIVRVEHLDAAVTQMLVHAELLLDPPEEAPDLEVFATALGRTLVHGLYLHDVPATDDARALAKDGVRKIIDAAGLRATNNNHHQTAPEDGEQPKA